MASLIKSTKLPRHVVDEINSAVDLYTDAKTGKTYREIALLKVKKDEIVRILPHKVIFVDKCHLVDKYDIRINAAIKNLGEKTFFSTQPIAGMTRVLRFEDVLEELGRVLGFGDNEGDDAFLTQNMRKYEKDNNDEKKKTN
jgi:hypothetical protein